MDSLLFPEYLKVGPLRLPKVIWNIIKEYMPYCHQCYVNIDKIYKYFEKYNEINLKHIDTNAQKAFNGQYMFPNYHTMIMYNNQVKYEVSNEFNFYRSKILSVDNFAIFLAHMCHYDNVNIQNKHLQPGISHNLIDYYGWYTCAYPYQHNSVTCMDNNITSVILHIILNKN